MAKKVNTRFGLVMVGVMKGQNRSRIQRTIDGKKYQFVARSVSRSTKSSQLGVSWGTPSRAAPRAFHGACGSYN